MKRIGRPRKHTLFNVTKMEVFLWLIKSIGYGLAIIFMVLMVIALHVGMITVWLLKLPFRFGFYAVKYRWGRQWLSGMFLISLVYLSSFGVKTYAEQRSENTHLQNEVYVLSQSLKSEQERNDALAYKLSEKQQTIGRQISPQAKVYVASLIKKYFGTQADSALRVFTCESGLSPFNYSNKPNFDGSEDHGVAQINDKWHKARFEAMFGIPFEIGIYIPELNIQYAKYLWDHSGASPWVCSKVLKG